MFPARPVLVHLAVSAVVFSLLAGCATTRKAPSGGSAEQEPTASQPAAETDPPETLDSESEPASQHDGPASRPAAQTPSGPENRAASRVADQLARQLRTARENVSIAEVTKAEWPNSCLGLPAEDEICASVITPGYAISVVADGLRYDFRTDESGERIRLASAPLESPGKPLLTWRDSRSFSILIVGTERVAFGRRGRPTLVAPLGVPERARELEKMLAEYTTFQARTPAGEVALAGVGSNQPTEVQARAMAHWAKLVSTEAERGLDERAADRVIVWRRTGGSAGVCDLVVVGSSGIATAYSCRGGTERAIATVALAEAELEQLFTWLDRVETFAMKSDDPALEDGMSITLDFAGEGFEPASETERDAIMAFANRLVTRLVTAQPEA